MMTVQESLPWKEEAEKSSIPRFPWKQHLGVPLRQFAYRRASWGWTQEAVRAEVGFILNSKGIVLDKHINHCLWIGVSAGFTEYKSISQGEKMEENIEEIPNTPEGFNTQVVSWDELDTGRRKSSTYLDVEPDKAYQIVIAKADLKRDSIYKDKHGNPKLKVVLTLSNVNNEEVKDLKWETGSWTIIKALKEAREEGKLASTVWLLKKKRENDRISYVFERIGETSPSPSSSEKDKELEAFL